MTTLPPRLKFSCILFPNFFRQGNRRAVRIHRLRGFHISPNCCVIRDRKPEFLTVSDLLRYSVDHTQEMLRQELEIKLGETREQQMFASLEKIFIEERMYKDEKVEQSRDMESAIRRVDETDGTFQTHFLPCGHR